MRRYQFWSLTYLINRVSFFIYEKRNPDLPWLTPAANEFLNSYLRKSDRGLEFGSGRSTLWFSKKVSNIVSVEHNFEWGRKISTKLSELNINNIDYHIIPKDVQKGKGKDSNYVQIMDKYDPNSFDFCLIDGAYRDHCSLKAIDMVKPGGILVIDNVNRYLPSDTCSPQSIKVDGEPKSSTWKEFQDIVLDWRKIWTSSGVTDTAIFIKPFKEG